MKTQPLISVIIAVKNSERYLPEAIESVISQTFKNTEMIVVDGGSTDRSREMASSYSGVRIVDQKLQGFADAWNVGIDAAQGEFIAILDSDDVWLREKLERQMDIFAKDSEIYFSITRMKFFLAPGSSPPPGFKPELLNSDHVAYMPSALLARKSLFHLIGTFNTKWKIASDVDWFARAKDRGLKPGIVPEVLLHKRIHDGNLSYNFSQTSLYRQEMLKVMKETAKRRGAIEP